MKKLLIILVLSSQLLAQGFDGGSLGLADNFSALARGIHAVNFNPANVGLPRGNTLELNIVGVNVSLFNNSFSLNNYNNFFVTNGEENRWSESDRKEFLDLIPDNGLKLNSTVVGNAFGFAFNNFALAVQPVVFSGAQTLEDKSLLEIAFFGDVVTRDYLRKYEDFVNGSGFGAVKVSLAYGYPILKIQDYLPDFSYLAVGVGLNYFIAFGVAEVQNSDLIVSRTPFDNYELDELMASFKIRTALAEGADPVGMGRSFNLGFATRYKQRWDFSLSFLNLAGSIDYTVNTELLVLNEWKSIKNYYPADYAPETEEISEDTTYAIDGFSTDIPTTMRFGAAYRFWPNLTFTAEWVQGLDHSFGNTTTPRIGGGVLYRPLPWLPLRGGVSVGGNYGFLLAMGGGVDLKYWTFDLGFAMKNALWPTYSEGLFLGLNMMFKL